jgi:hypothetical protein
MSYFNTHTVKVSQAVARRANAIIDNARAQGAGSNRTDWARTLTLLAACEQVIAFGVPVVVSVGTPAYHITHRALNTGILRPYWSKVQVVALRDVKWEGSVVSGETDTVRGTTVLICPVR